MITIKVHLALYWSKAEYITYLCILFIYIYRERERCRCIYTHMYNDTYTHTYMLLYYISIITIYTYV